MRVTARMNEARDRALDAIEAEEGKLTTRRYLWLLRELIETIEVKIEVTESELEDGP